MSLLAKDIMLKAFTDKVAKEFGSTEKTALSRSDLVTKSKGLLRKARNIVQKFTPSGRTRTLEAKRLRSARNTARNKASLEGREARRKFMLMLQRSASCLH